ncbi:1-hydroxycarotenoid 3,4-desaturase CrtD [Palleronia abyssalis]|uniref:Hydroxyneurosporene desaturase n=1 Tax=Palleronia abyssalis TaxID=1501240 RepID=A0A2R8BSA5_9RHOB|nr:1-hydroxycarotenoid 3,4-desaturase CrtD [Palleronia abyssalis]SPJ23032.1 Hydroxyneurosporene desaturase [Palleronia abyssalis]
MARTRIIVVGAGIGGLSSAMRVAHAGCHVKMFEASAAPGGKMRTIPSKSGPVDAGPTVLTMRGVFDDLFEGCGHTLSQHITLDPEPVLARHFWPDGSRLDLFSDPEASAEAVDRFAGPQSADDFRRFHAETRRLFRAFEAPVMRQARPSPAALTTRTLADPALIRAMAPLSTLAQRLGARFRDPRLAQLFGRYATYVGGSPYRVPALLALVWQAEAQGVWRVRGGMHRLAAGMADAAAQLGVEIAYDAPVARIESGPAVVLADGTRHTADAVIFNGDPRALRTGHLGPDPQTAVPRSAVHPRSLSAEVWAFAGTPEGADLHHHNIFFGADPTTEFKPITHGAAARDPSIYICAQDRGTGRAPPETERFETIVNAAPISEDEEPTPCFNRTFETLASRGLTFRTRPDPSARTTPQDFAALFPGSLGSLYGRSPEGMLATFQRPGARSKMPGLYLAGGGVHPGAGVPMAALSGKHAAEAILKDRTST